METKLPTFSPLPAGPYSEPVDVTNSPVSSTTQAPLDEDKPLLESKMDAEARENGEDDDAA